jgi:hypothetical protein
MALHVEFSTDIKVYGNTLKDKLKGSLVIADKVMNVLTLESSARVSLAASATDVAYNMQGIASGKLVLLESDKPFSFKLNGAAVGLALKPQANSSDGTSIPACAMLMTDAITSLSLTNPDTGSAIEVDVTVCG